MHLRFVIAVALLVACSTSPSPSSTETPATASAQAPATPVAEPTKPADPPAKLAPVEKDDLYGYADPSGTLVLPARYRMAMEFTDNGIAAVVDDEGWAYIDRSGTVLVRPFIFDNGPDPFVDGLARHVAGGKYGFFDETGRVVIEAKFDFAAPFAEGLAPVCDGCTRKMMGEHWTMVGGSWGYVDRQGKLAIPMKFEHAGEFEGGRATVKVGGAAKTIDKTGAFVP